MGCHFLFQEIFLTQGSNRVSCVSCIAGEFLAAGPPGKPIKTTKELILVHSNPSSIHLWHTCPPSLHHLLSTSLPPPTKHGPTYLSCSQIPYSTITIECLPSFKFLLFNSRKIPFHLLLWTWSCMSLSYPLTYQWDCEKWFIYIFFKKITFLKSFLETSICMHPHKQFSPSLPTPTLKFENLLCLGGLWEKAASNYFCFSFLWSYTRVGNVLWVPSYSWSPTIPREW